MQNNHWTTRDCIGRYRITILSLNFKWLHQTLKVHEYLIISQSSASTADSQVFLVKKQ
jgi:hypothetical protein